MRAEAHQLGNEWEQGGESNHFYAEQERKYVMKFLLGRWNTLYYNANFLNQKLVSYAFKVGKC